MDWLKLAGIQPGVDFMPLEFAPTGVAHRAGLAQAATADADAAADADATA